MAKYFKVIKEDGEIADIISAENAMKAWWIVIMECNFYFKIQEATREEMINWRAVDFLEKDMIDTDKF